jgi:hypothetical protein
VLHAVIGQVTDTNSTSTHVNAGLLVASIAVGLVLALLPAWLAGRKGYSFALFYLFGLLCWIPAVIVAAVISDKTKVPPGGFGYNYGPTTSPVWTTPGAPPVPSAPLPPPGWYPDPGGTPQQRYWDGNTWTEHLH